MPIGAFTGSFDLPLLLVIVFFLFFLALVYYLRQEDKREGYPLASSRTARSGGRVAVVGFPPLPSPKTFILPHGRPPVQAPKPEEPSPVPAPDAGNITGLPVNRDAMPLGTNLGPGSYSMREDIPDLSHDGNPLFRPLRHATAFRVMKGEPDPRGFTVLGLDKMVAGEVVDIWIDEGEHFAKFLEVSLHPDLRDGRAARTAASTQVVGVVVTEEIVATPIGAVDIVEVEPIVATHDTGDRDTAAPAAGSILLPMEFAAVNQIARTVRCAAITSDQFADVPRRKADLVITAREENQLRGYYGGGFLWATPNRAEPLL